MHTSKNHMFRSAEENGNMVNRQIKDGVEETTTVTKFLHSSIWPGWEILDAVAIVVTAIQLLWNGSVAERETMPGEK